MKPLALALVALCITAPLAAQTSSPSILGTWKVDARQLTQKDAPRTVIVRADSSASWGTETARWRIKGNRLWLAIGGEWEDYKMSLKGTKLTLSEGDLTKPIGFERIGAPTPRPANVPVPPDPDATGGG